MTCLSLVIMALVTFAAPGDSAPSADQIATWTRQLGDDQLKVRNEASDALWRAGEAAKSALEIAANSSDLEVATRARSLLDRIRLGLVPGADSAITEAIQRYRLGNADEKKKAAEELLKKGEIERLRWLVDREEDTSLRASLNKLLIGDLLRQVTDEIAQEHYEAAARLLEDIHRRGGAIHLATYLHLRGETSERLAQLKEMPSAETYSPDGALLWYLARLTHDPDTAMKVAIAANRSEWKAATTHSTYDWKSLALTRAKQTPAANASILTRVQHYGGLAALRKFAHQTSAYDEAVQKLLDLKEQADDVSLGKIAEAFMLLGSIDKADAILRGRRRVQLAEMLSHQGRFHEAFTALAIHEPLKSLDWFEKLDPQDPRIKIDSSAHPIQAGKLAARMLYILGERETAIELFEKIAQLGTDNNTKAFALMTAAQGEWELGIGESCERHVAEALGLGNRKAILSALFLTNTQSSRANLWLNHLEKQRPESSLAERVQIVRQLFIPVHQPRLSGKEWKAIIDEGVLAAEEMSPADRQAWWSNLGETCMARREYARANEFFRNVLDFNDLEPGPSTASALLRVADVESTLGHWSEAAKLYALAWESDRSQALPRYLHGVALSHTDDKSRAAKIIEHARLLPLGDQAARHDLAAKLKSRQLVEQAGREFATEIDLSLFQDWNTYTAGQEVAHLQSRTDPGGAAQFWQLFTVQLVETSTSGQRDGMLRVPQNIHKLLALQALAKKDFAEASKQLDEAVKIIPHDIDLALAFIPKLVEAKQKDAADALFEKIYKANVTICEQFPRAATYHNNLAWLAAKAERRMGEALEHAKKAVELRPESAGHLDTLAEVHFKRGERDDAIRLAKRCIELAPDEVTYQKQLERFNKP